VACQQKGTHWGARPQTPQRQRLGLRPHLPAAADCPDAPRISKAAPAGGFVPALLGPSSGAESPQQAAKEARGGRGRVSSGAGIPGGSSARPFGWAEKAPPRRAQQKGAPPPRFPTPRCTPLRPASRRRLIAPQQKAKAKHEPSSPNQHVERGSPKSKSKAKAKARLGFATPDPQPDPVACARKKAHAESSRRKRKPARRYAPSNPAAVSCITLNGLP